MGAKAKRLDRIKAQHPICYFCGVAPTETEDHVPSRECFRRREGPEGFGFPACRECNHSASQMEQAIALYILVANFDGVAPDDTQFAKLVNGVRNNTPALSPRMVRTARAARDFMKRQGIPLRPGQTYAETPLAVLPGGHRQAFDLFGRRLTCALHYKHVGKPLALDHYIRASWLPWSHPSAPGAVEASASLFPNLEKGKRSNTDIGEQFLYRWVWNADEATFGFTAQFSQSVFISGASSPSNPSAAQEWRLHSSDVPWVL